MDKQTQKNVLFAIFNMLLELDIKGKNSEDFTKIKDGIGQVHDAISNELTLKAPLPKVIAPKKKNAKHK